VVTEWEVFVHDVIISSRSVQEHVKGQENVSRRFDKAHMQLHPGKYVIARPQLNYLGFVLSEKGVAASPDKIKPVRNYPTRKTSMTFSHI